MKSFNEKTNFIMTNKIISINDFKFQEEVGDPFIIRMHHIDYYPKGNGNMAVSEEYLDGKQIGEDFDLSSDFKMYYGKDVPGFPVHPHRGFETVTVVMQGFVDHSDSFGATGRYGAGDVQWMTAGKGMQHAEMMPLVYDDKENTMELFQIWLNLPPESKFVEPSYKMLWAEDVPVVKDRDETGNTATITLVAGSYNGVNIIIDDTQIKNKSSIKLVGDQDIKVVAGEDDCYLLLLEGEPIGKPVVSRGPFVMNTVKEIQQAFQDYKATQFGGWPFDESGPVNAKNSGRFARYSDGNIEQR